MDLKGRAAALIVCGALTVGATVACVTVGAGGSGTIYTKALGVKPDTAMVTVNDKEIPASFYLYWVAADCDYLSQYLGDAVTWTDEISEGVTYQQYVLDDVDSRVEYYAALELLADEYSCGLTEEQSADIATIHDSYVQYYGDEETYMQQLNYYGLSEADMAYTATTSYILANLCDIMFAEGGELYATEDAVTEWATGVGYADKGYSTEDLTKLYESTDYGVINTFISGYMSTLTLNHGAAYDKIDLNTFVPAFRAAREALEPTAADSTTGTDDAASAGDTTSDTEADTAD